MTNPASPPTLLKLASEAIVPLINGCAKSVGPRERLRFQRAIDYFGPAIAASWREWARRSEGCYLLRSNVIDWTPEELWRAYVQLTEAEAAFRVHKSDLQIRPVWHHREHRVGAHILVCFLAYVLWKTLAASCRQGGLGDEPRQVFEELCEISLVDVILPTRQGVEVRKRCISQPTEHQRILLQRLGMRLPIALEQA